MVSISGHVMASGDHGSSSTVPVISAINEPGLRNDDPSAYAVAVTAGAQDVRQPLAQPPFDAAGRHQDEFLGERVGQWVGQQCAQPVGQQVGALGTVDVKCHRWPP